MRVVVQRVKGAAVRVDGNEIARIGRGLLVLVGFISSDTNEVIEWMARKILSLRVFPDDEGKMNLNLDAVDGDLLLVSQFTLYGDCNKGTRPSFDKSAPADLAEALYDRFLEILTETAPSVVKSGVFQAHMEIGLVNDGPVTLTIDREAA
jgi:D-tyrosyl-tRNA(Tyr) deacylase